MFNPENISKLKEAHAIIDEVTSDIFRTNFTPHAGDVVKLLRVNKLQLKDILTFMENQNEMSGL